MSHIFVSNHILALMKIILHADQYLVRPTVLTILFIDICLVSITL